MLSLISAAITKFVDSIDQNLPPSRRLEAIALEAIALRVEAIASRLGGKRCPSLGLGGSRLASWTCKFVLEVRLANLFTHQVWKAWVCNVHLISCTSSNILAQGSLWNQIIPVWLLRLPFFIIFRVRWN